MALALAGLTPRPGSMTPHHNNHRHCPSQDLHRIYRKPPGKSSPAKRQPEPLPYMSNCRGGVVREALHRDSNGITAVRRLEPFRFRHSAGKSLAPIASGARAI